LAACFVLLSCSLAFAELNDSVNINCTQNKTMEYLQAYQAAHNPCWGWLDTHTYDLAKENNGEVRGIAELNVTHNTGIGAGCRSVSKIMVSNDTSGWKVLGEVELLAYTKTTRSFSDVGAYRYVRIENGQCKVDWSGINVTFNETANLVLNSSEARAYRMVNGTAVELNGAIRPGEALLFNVTVRNKGTMNATNFTVRFQDDNDPEDERGFTEEAFVGRLDVNKSINVSFFWNATGRTRNVSFWADSGKVIKETDELDNFAQKRIEIEGEPDYSWYYAGGICLGFVLLITVAGLMVWRQVSFAYSPKTGIPCARCGMPLSPGKKSCPVCGKRL